MMTPPLSICARPRLAVQVPVSGAWPLVVGADGEMGSTDMTGSAPREVVWPTYPYISWCYVRVYGYLCSQSLARRPRGLPRPIQVQLARCAAGGSHRLFQRRFGRHAARRAA